jgi:hypothetical protein
VRIIRTQRNARGKLKRFLMLQKFVTVMTSGLKTFKTNFNIILSIDTKMLHALSPYCIPIKSLYAVLVTHTCFEVYPSILLDLVTQPYLKQGACYSSCYFFSHISTCLPQNRFSTHHQPTSHSAFKTAV